MEDPTRVKVSVTTKISSLLLGGFLIIIILALSAGGALWAIKFFLNAVRSF
jgi:hypothetical protein